MITEQIASQQRRGLISADADPRTIAIGLISAFNGMRMMVLLGIGRDEIRRRWIELGRTILGIKDGQGES